MEAIKNDYLNHVIKDINPRILNRMVNKVIIRDTKCYDFEPPILKLQSTIPNIYGPHVDVTRAKVAFGRWALPKLRRELHDDDPLIVSQAINSLADLIHDPEKSFEAIRLHFVPRLVDLMVHKDAFLRKRCAEIMTTLASQAVGREAILKNATMITNMAITVHDDHPEVRLKASQAVEMVARTYQGTDILNNANFVPLLASKMMHEIDDIVHFIGVGGGSVPVNPNDARGYIHANQNLVGQVLYQATMRLKELIQLMILEHLLTVENVVGEAIDQGTMGLMEVLMNRQRPDVVARAISCLQLLLVHPSGKKIAVTTNLTHGLKRALFSEDREVHTMATAALMFITITTMGKKEALKINIMDRLLELASDFNCKELQINCVKTLTNMAEAPEGRKKLLENHIPAIEAIRTLKDQNLERHICTLLDTVRWKP
ncbi:unnamed protein product [Timema podura]|uniref:Rhabdoid tumor deletion region protein 1 n=1 Tax=Timema podura TaxID=61482 RepID=A0ABN7P1N7_TIMPD|nr:unnamed protein product [Timema podura]